MIRLALKSELASLQQLAVRSKAYWPYEKEFVDKCAPFFKVNLEDFANNRVFVYESDGRVLGFYSFTDRALGPEMHLFFVEPEFIGKGIGRQLWCHAVDFAKEQGWQSFKIVSDPYAAESFYQKVGCILLGEKPSEVFANRLLPVLEYRLS